MIRVNQIIVKLKQKKGLRKKVIYWDDNDYDNCFNTLKSFIIDLLNRIDKSKKDWSIIIERGD